MHHITLHINKFFLAIIALIISGHAYCQVSNDSTLAPVKDLSSRELNICDSSDQQFTKFKPQQLIVPGAFMVSGLIGAIDSKNNLNRSVNDALTGLSDGHHCKIDDYLRFLPSAAHLVMGSLGVKSKHNFKERFLISATAHASMLILGYSMKYSIHEQRPDFSDNHSFPSGHVAMAFTGAELLRAEYGTTYGIAGYAVATGVAFLRLYNNRHWFNDVLMGAGIGILSARIGCWLLPFERKLFKIRDKSKCTSTIAVTPTYNAFDKAYMMSLNAVF
jgi:hypothetical protein